MSFSPIPPNMLSALYSQHVAYSAELASTHHALSKLYKKLAKVERVLAERDERQLSRANKKKWQYTRAISKRAVTNLETQQAELHDKLYQCNNLIASFEQGAYNSPMTPWTAQMPPSPFLFTPFSPVAYPPWPASSLSCLRPSGSGASGQSGTQPQYWDLSMLRERRHSSPYGSSADSGFYEPLVHGLGPRDEPIHDANHVYAHELMSPLAPIFHSQPAESNGVEVDGEDSTSAAEQRNEVLAPKTPVSPARVGAESTKPHKRCYSVGTAAPQIKSHLEAPSTKRANSVGGPRNVIEETLAEASREMEIA
ncbi:Hypothetical predicted protein [Lecanosticta acicola]|uniref:Uncharacterized protein n=1 Tax=Lecanosticta acicola TaxID=111012 RepID=A0AAI9E925_9PEZI|nr:Hypothetical predicted protein [Lecanosticta acicola]